MKFDVISRLNGHIAALDERVRVLENERQIYLLQEGLKRPLPDQILLSTNVYKKVNGWDVVRAVADHLDVRATEPVYAKPAGVVVNKPEVQP